MVVLLPAPFGPRSPKISPLPMVKETPLTASFLPKVLIRLVTSTTTDRPSFGRWIGPVLEKFRMESSTVFLLHCLPIVVITSYIKIEVTKNYYPCHHW